MKVKDLKVKNLKGVKVKIPKKYDNLYYGVSGTMYVTGVWAEGIWFIKHPEDTKVYPMFIKPKELLNFTVVE